MQAKAISEEIQIPGGTMHYTFDIHALALIAWNPEPLEGGACFRLRPLQCYSSQSHHHGHQTGQAQRANSIGQHIGTDVRWKQRPREQPTVLRDGQAWTTWYARIRQHGDWTAALLCPHHAVTGSD
eukprot:6213128-Pleurochrysis_carterae.AAC.1